MGESLKRRLFISHTSKTASADTRLERLRAALAAQDFDVIVDRHQLRAGDEWRREIYTWLGLCEVAVVLIAPRALDPANPWVSREATILMWRRALDPSFIVVPVLVDGVELADLEDGPFRDLLLNELQGEIVTADHTDEWIVRLAGQLAEKARACTPAPLAALARPVAQQLSGVPGDVLREAADMIAVELGPWKPQADMALELAVQLLHLGLEGSFAALDHLAVNGMDAGRLEHLIELIAPSWVDLCAAQCLAEVAGRQQEYAALWLNAESLWAARMFILRASARPPGTEWDHVPIAVQVDEGGLESLVHQLREALILKLKIEVDVFAQDTQARLARQLQLRMKARKPVFAVVQHSAGLMQYLDALKAHFPSLCFLVLGGAGLSEDDLEPGMRIIVPRLGPNEEANARDSHGYVRGVLIKD